MGGINQLPAGAEPAAAISLTWASLSWLCSSVLMWLTWSHHEGFSYLALLAVSSLFSTTFSIVQQSRDITWYQDIVTAQFARKQKLPGDDPELAIAGGSFGVDLVLYYLQYYSYNVQAMLVMFWAAELCQLTYQVGERRKIRRILRKLHVAGKFVSWLLPLITISSLQTPALKANFLPFILIADLPLMISLAIGSGLMIAVTIRYIQSRQKFTQWSPPNFNSNTSGSEAGTGGSLSGTQSSSRPSNNKAMSMGRKGLYDRWLMVRFTIAFVLLAVFEVTNTLFQITALNNNINDTKAQAPDLSAARATQTLFLFMPGTTPGIFIFVVFGTTASSRQKLAAAARQFMPPQWRGASTRGCLPCFGHRGGKRRSSVAPELPVAGARGRGEITIERSLTITSANRFRGSSGKYSEDDLSDPSDIWMSDLPGKRSDSAASFQDRMKPLPNMPGGGGGGGGLPSSRFRTVATCGLSHAPTENTTAGAVSPLSGRLAVIDERSNATSEYMSRPTTGDSLQVPDDYHSMDPEHSDDSGPILPIQRHEVRFSMDVSEPVRGSRQLKNFSRPRR